VCTDVNDINGFGVSLLGLRKSLTYYEATITRLLPIEKYAKQARFRQPPAG
jgi:hypothetical protein